MDSNNLFFEIKNLEIANGYEANMVMVENDGKGPAYLGWCENLAIDAAVAPCSEAGPGVLLLPFTDIGILSRQGTPIPAPEGWREMVARSLVIQDYLMVMIETELELNVTASL